jgi:type II secretory ATPase GspE/PulE/Tfp pilus assembly ATPase PilB-like protein
LPKLTLAVDDGTAERLRNLAEASGQTVSALVEAHIAELAQNRLPPVEAATPADLAAVANFQGRVLTAEGGPVWASRKQRTAGAYLDNGWLVLAEEDRNAPELAALRAALIRDGKVIARQVQVTRQAVRDAYSRSVTGAGPGAAVAPENHLLELLSEAVSVGASEVHVAIEKRRTSVRFRIGGLMTPPRVRSREEGERIVGTTFLYDERTTNRADSDEPRQVRLEGLSGRSLPPGVDCVVVNWVPSATSGSNAPKGGGIGVLRVVRPREEAPPLDGIGLSGAQLSSIRFAASRANGLVAVAGPIGSGRTTTLAAMLSDEGCGMLRRNLVSVEDPPEHLVRGATEIRIEESTSAAGLSGLARAIAAARNVGPDALAVGEITNSEATRIAFEAASAQVSVWATLKARSALSVPRRLAELGADRASLLDPERLPLLIGQRLLEMPCKECGQRLSAGKHPEVCAWLDRLKPGTAARAMFSAGCEEGCQGASKRILVAEIVPSDRRILEMALDGKDETAWEVLRERRTQSMAERAADLVADGHVDALAAWRALA